MDYEKYIEIDKKVAEILGYEWYLCERTQLLKIIRILETQQCLIPYEDFNNLSLEEIYDKYPLKWNRGDQSKEQFTCTNSEEEIIEYILTYYGGFKQEFLYSSDENTKIRFTYGDKHFDYEYLNYWYGYHLGQFLIDLENS